MIPNLALCVSRSSCIVQASVDDVWRIIQDWSYQSWVTEVDGQPVKVRAVEGIDNAVGSIRVVTIGNAQMFERLVAIDEEEHSLKWRLISHPGNVSPFNAASYVNYSATLLLKPVTHGNHTFVEWKGEFYTEHIFAIEMQATFVRWFETGLRQLQALGLSRSAAGFVIPPADLPARKASPVPKMAPFIPPTSPTGHVTGLPNGVPLASSHGHRRPVGSVHSKLRGSPIGSFNSVPGSTSLNLGEPQLQPLDVSKLPPAMLSKSRHQWYKPSR